MIKVHLIGATVIKLAELIAGARLRHVVLLLDFAGDGESVAVNAPYILHTQVRGVLRPAALEGPATMLP